jgi:serine phosphatase RsbU (regulator of sigma subunit)
MSLRLRLVLLYLVLAVLPLAGITVYYYLSSERALREAVAAEGRSLAADMTRRLESTSEDLGRRLERASRLPFAPASAEDEEARLAQRERLLEHFRAELGDWADLVESFEIVPAPPPPPAPPRPDAPGPDRMPPPRLPQGEVVVVEPEADPGSPNPTHPRLVWHQILRGEELTPEQERVLAEGAESQARAFAERLERRLREVEREIETAPDPAAKARELGRQALVLGGKALAALIRNKEEIHDLLRRELDFQLVHEGEALGTLQARVRGRRLIERTLARTPRDRGEIPFAVDEAGEVHTADAGERERLVQLGVPGITDPKLDSQVLRTSGDWVLVTRRDAESGLTLGIARPIGESLRELRLTALRNLGYGLALAGLACVGIVPISRRMTRNLATLTEGAERLAGGDLDTRVPVRSRDEFGRLAETFNQMASSLRAQQEGLLERERLRKELEMSRLIQEELLPHEPLCLEFAEVSGISLPAREVGGDFFNYFTLADGSLAVLVGDVSGKGVPAALLAANLQATLRARLPLERDLATLAASLDEQVEASTPGSVYVTLFMAVLSRERRTLRWVNAGHNPQFLLRAEGGAEALGSGGRPLGLLPGGGFEPGERALGEGDALFLYTDGLTDSENPAGDYFGRERLEELLREAGDAPAGVLLGRIEEAAQRFRDGVEAGDDATLVVLRLSPPSR